MSKQTAATHSPTIRSFKVWSADRTHRKSILATSLAELKSRAAEKFCYNQSKSLRLVLEQDGTEIEDNVYLFSSEPDTVFLLLRDAECWLNPGIDTLTSALSAIPQIVCDTINSMKLAHRPPTWSIRDEQGVITITLQWDKDEYMATHRQPWEEVSEGAFMPEKAYSSTFPRSHRTKQVPESGRWSASVGRTSPFPFVPPSKTLSADDFSYIERAGEDFSSGQDLVSFCDFHCSTLHRAGCTIKVSRSVATSPIPSEYFRSMSPSSRTASPFDRAVLIPTPTSSIAGSMTPIPQSVNSSGVKAKKGPVRFLMEKKSKTKSPSSSASAPPNNGAKSPLLSFINGNSFSSEGEGESGESESELTEIATCSTRYLLLVDQLSANQIKHLTIKDIGIILERLRSKIPDVDKLERAKETADCFHWLIKATIRGEMLKDVGVVYNGQYYGLMEHPAYY